MLESTLYALTLLGGQVACMELVPGHELDEEIAKYEEASGVVVTSYREIDYDKVPPKEMRVFRSAWTDTFDTDTIDVDLDRAKEIQKDRWREARKPLLEKSDIDLMKALEVEGIEAFSAVRNYRQALRDVTKADMSHIRTPEELKDFFPQVLTEEGKNAR